MDVIRGRLDADGSATVQRARCADALVALSEQALNRGDLPTVAGERPHVTVTMTLADVRDNTGHGTLNTGAPISAETARRMVAKSITSSIGPTVAQQR